MNPFPWRSTLIACVISVVLVLAGKLMMHLGDRLETEKADELAGHIACAPERLVKVINGSAVCETPDPWPERRVVPLKK